MLALTDEGGRLFLYMLVALSVVCSVLAAVLTIFVWRMVKYFESNPLTHELKGINYLLADVSKSLMSIETRLRGEEKLRERETRNDLQKRERSGRSSRRDMVLR